MIRNLSIKKKIVIWFSLSMVLIIGIMMWLTFAISQSVFSTDIQTQLVNLVNANAEEIEYLNSHELEEEYEAGDQFLEYKKGYLEIDDDFCDYENGIYTCLVDSENNLLYGVSPIRLSREEVFTYLDVKPLKYRGERYYVFERPLHGSNLEGLWIRGVASRSEGTHLLSTIIGYATWLLPLLAAISVLVGYLITRRSLAPAEQIIATAESINSGNDLSRRIEIPAGRNEFHVLAHSYNRMFDRLESAFQREKQFTSDVSHELRTPTAVILSQCEFSLEMAETLEDYREALETIQQQSLKMKELISQLLFFSRLEQGRQPQQVAVCDLTALVSDICHEQEHLASQAGGLCSSITLSLNLCTQVWAPVDSRLFSRVVSNLVSNAYKYGRQDGSIKVSLYKTSGMPGLSSGVSGLSSGLSSGSAASRFVVLQVADDGIGIPAEHLPRIFDRFYQVDPSRTASQAGPDSAEAGAGLGLSMVREIVQLHGGQVTAESTPGKGSLFTVILPAER